MFTAAGKDKSGVGWMWVAPKKKKKKKAGRNKWNVGAPSMWGSCYSAPAVRRQGGKRDQRRQIFGFFKRTHNSGLLLALS